MKICNLSYVHVQFLDVLFSSLLLRTRAFFISLFKVTQSKKRDGLEKRRL